MTGTEVFHFSGQTGTGTVTVFTAMVRRAFTLGLAAYRSQNNLNDFKILRLVCFQSVSVEAEAKVYTLRTNSWRKLEISMENSSICFIDNSDHLFFNGALHSITISRDHKFILCFDMDDERFRKIMLPQTYFDTTVSRRFESLVVFKGFLALIVFSNTPNNRGICQICVMKEYGVVESWTEKTVPMEGVTKLLGCTLNGELLIEKQV